MCTPVNLLLFTLLVVLPTRVLSANSEFERFCNPPSEPTSQTVCALSKELNVSPLKTGTGMLLASLQITGTYCNFSFTKKFIDMRLKFEADLEIAKVVRHLIASYRDKSPPGYNGDPRVFCKMQYETFGSRSKEKIFQ